MADYVTGAVNSRIDSNFVSTYDAHKPEIENKVIERWGTTYVGFLDMVGAKKGVSAKEYSRFERNRRMSKMKATIAGAGAGLQATFTVDASAKVSIPSASPYDTSATPDGKAMPIRMNDLILIPPATGTTAAFGNYIEAIVDEVTNNTEFKATPLNGSKSIPTAASAIEIIIYGNAHGEASTFNSAMSNSTTKYTEYLTTIKDRLRRTGSEGLVQKWYKDNGGTYRFQVEGEGEAYMRFLEYISMTLLINTELSNTGVADDFQAADTPLTMGNGLLTTIVNGGTVLNYSSIAGLSMDDMKEYNIDLDTNKGDKNNLFFAGIVLDQDLDSTLGDRVKNGGISYGTYNMTEEKAINLSFQKFRIGSYAYDKRCMELFNDLQTLGADGFGFKNEAFTLSSGLVKVEGGLEEGSMVAVLRKTFLEGNGRSREMIINFYDGLKHAAEGDDFQEVRYLTECGLELQAVNKTGYIKQA